MDLHGLLPSFFRLRWEDNIKVDLGEICNEERMVFLHRIRN
jgi:hypothetical protein